MAKTVYKIPFGQGYKIMQRGTLIERASLAKRYPLIAAAMPEEVLLAIENLSMRQVETQLRNFVAAGHSIGTDHSPSLAQFATVVEDNQSEADLDVQPPSDDDEPVTKPEVVASDVEETATEEDEPSIECRYALCEEGPFNTIRGRNIHETRIHGSQFDTVAVDEPTQADIAEVEVEPTVEEPTVPSVSELVEEREAEQVVAAGASITCETEEPGSDLDIFSDGSDEEEDELEALLNPPVDEPEDKQPVVERAPAGEEEETEEEEDDFLKSLGIVEM